MKKENNSFIIGHLFALLTVFIWGTTFISTKVLLVDFSPFEILFTRFLLGYLILWLVQPHRLKKTTKAQEAYFALAGIFGVTLYFFLENIALTYSTASNIGVIVAVSPFFTALLSHFFFKDKIKVSFFLGFFLSILGIALLSFNGATNLHLNPIGDLLGIGAAFCWAIYSNLLRKIGEFHFTIIQTTRRIFFYGLLFMLPILAFSNFSLTYEKLINPNHLANILFLGIGASAICFVTWSSAVQRLGAIRTSIYIYLVPVITVFFSLLILHENLTWIAFIGILLTLSGLFLSERANK